MPKEGTMLNDELFSNRVYPHLDAGSANWVIAFDEDGRYYADAMPGSDFYIPVPDAYATREGALAAIEVLKVWDAPVANDDDVLGFDALRVTPQWAALVPHLPQAIVPDLTDFDFNDAMDALPGAYAHYRAMTAAGVQVR
jgi:hypothetical protein